MRISDWSSDVCSSDLAGARAGEGYGVGLSDVSGPGRRGTVVRRSAGIVGRDPRCGCARAEGRGNPRAPRGNLTPDGRGRSEEHTSELQSLMRTSYAVFCLEKKRDKIYNKEQQQSERNKQLMHC